MSSCISFVVVVNCMHSNHINLKVFGHRKFFQQQNSEFYIWLCGKGVLKILPLIIQGFYYHNPSSRAHYFMKIFIFLVGTTNWGVQEPHKLIRYCSPIYALCVLSHYWPFTKANLVLENFNKNLGFGQTPAPRPPCWAECPTFSENRFWWPP